jgi:hypothetical protein
MRQDSDHDEKISSEPASFGHRHGVTIMTVVLMSLLVLVCIIQVAC